eukprot:TRINITY_DN64_c2_g1_i1.p1 TRINITY_DN64_c2_g1~~TRINITY_DN64_c2_g1_i1.p1  ORF type:complete len:142 (-),score=25.92 TRINITY_DN64_c2_g1_i1:154-579(-)
MPRSGRTKSYPSYRVMIHEALANSDRRVCSKPVISSYILTNFDIDIVEGTFKTHLTRALKKEVELGSIVQVKASYKLSAKTKADIKKAAAKAKPKPRKTTASKKKTTTKSRGRTTANSRKTKPKKKKVGRQTKNSLRTASK